MPAKKDADHDAEQGADHDDAPATTPSDSEPDIKAKFREALERKHGQHADSGGADGRSGGKGGGRSHGPARTQRTFRRKSG